MRKPKTTKKVKKFRLKKKRPLDADTGKELTQERDYLNDLLSIGSGDSHETENLDFLDEGATSEYNPLDEGEDFNIIDMVDEAISQESLVAPDMKIDDSSCPEAPNVLDWLLGDKFLGCEPPYLEQALICVKLFAEYCPNCSDTEWMETENHEPQEGLGGLIENVVMLNHGICPECDSHRSDLIAKGDLPFYNELACLAGQRCVTGDTLILSEHGIKRIDSWDTNKPVGFSPLLVDLHNGNELETTSQFYKSRPEQCHLIRLENGTKIKGTKDHPVYCYDRFKTLPNIKTGDWVPVKIGQNLWGKRILDYQTVLDRTELLFQQKLSTTINSKKHQLKNTNLVTINKVKHVDTDLYKLMGLWVSEGRGSGISNKDPEVLSFVYSTLNTYINKRYINLKHDGVSLSGYKAQCWYTSILDKESTECLWAGSKAQSIPSSVLEAPEEYVCAFLQGLYEGDGSVRDGRHSIKYYTISPTLAKELQVVLHNLGIACKVTKGYKCATNTVAKRKVKTYTVTIAGKYLKIFEEKIGFLSSYKKKDLANHIESFDNREVKQTFYYDKLPRPLFERIQNKMEEFRSELGQHVIRSSEQGVGGSKLGLQSVFGRDGCFVSSPNKRMSRDLPLTKSYLKRLCDRFLLFKNYLGKSSLKEIEYWQTFLDDSVYWQTVKSTSVSSSEYITYDFTLPKTHRFIANSLINHNSGKSIVTAMASTYITHRILKMQKPTEIFRVGKGQILHGTFVALTQGQAKDTLWEPFYGYLLESPWFKKYHALLRFYEKKYHQEFFKLKDTFVLYRHRALTVYPAGPDKRKLRGRTRIFGAIDEIGWFDNNKGSDKITMDANGVYEAMVRSLATVRSSEERLIGMNYDRAMTAYMLNISSPSSIRDKICELVRSAQNSVKTLGVHAPTWKMNPNITRQSGFLIEEFRKDPVTAMRDYGAEPPLSANAFINNKQLVQDALNPKHRNVINYKFEEITIGKEKYRSAVINKIKPTTRASILSIDAGYTNNSFSLTVGSMNEDGSPQIDLCVEIIPLPGIPLHYTFIYEDVIKPIIQERNVKVVLADRWNSIKLLQDMEVDFEDQGLVTRQYSLKYHDFWSFKTALEQYMIVIPNLNKGQDLESVLRDNLEEYPRCFEYKPAAHLALQILTVQDTGRTIVKGEGDLTDDLWRASVLFHWGIHQEEYIDLLSKQEEVKRRTTGVIGKALLGSNNSSTGTQGKKVVTSQTSGTLGMTIGRK